MFDASITKAPNFCACSYIHTFDLLDADFGRWEELSRPKRTQEALSFVKRKMSIHPHENRARYYLCDRTGEGMDKYICEYLPKSFTFGGHRYEVVRGRSFLNYNTGNMVRQTVIRRLD